MHNILALDISSTAIGWCYLQPDRAPLAKSIALGTSKNDIADRCAKAQAEVGLLLAACGSIDCVAIEAPVTLYPKFQSGCALPGVRRAARAVGRVVAAIGSSLLLVVRAA